MRGGRLTGRASASSLTKVKRYQFKWSFYVPDCIIPDYVTMLNTVVQSLLNCFFLICQSRKCVSLSVSFLHVCM